MQILNLTPYDNTLIGKYQKADTVVVLCDSTAGPFTVQLPDLTMAIDTRFLFKVVGSNVVTLKTVTGQYLDDITTIDLKQWKAIEIASDGNLRYIIINKYDESLLIF
jgi:hypothetical protein